MARTVPQRWRGLHGIAGARSCRVGRGRAGYGVGMESVDYTDTFITVAPDTASTAGVIPVPRPQGPTVASATYEHVGPQPYRLQSSEVIFSVWADRQGIPVQDRDAARSEFFAKPRACLRSSDLGKRFGWGIHADEYGRIALYSLGTAEYESLASGRTSEGRPVKIVAALRSNRR